MELGPFSRQRQLKKFVKEYWPFLGNSNLAMVMSILEEFSWLSHSGSGVNSTIRMNQNGGIDNFNKYGNGDANVGCSTSSEGDEGCVDGSKLSIR